MLYVVANVYSKVESNIQRQNLHQLLTCRIRPNVQRPTSAHHLFFRQPGTRSSRRMGLGLANKLESALRGQGSLQDSSEQIQGWVEKARRKNRGPSPPDDDHSG